jgi:hypothetical protein
MDGTGIGNSILYSYDPVSLGWTPCPGTSFGTNVGTSGTGYSIAYNDTSGLWIAVGNNITNNGNNIIYSYDPVSIGWLPCPGSPFGNNSNSIGYDIAYNDASGLWIAVGSDGNGVGDTILYSYDPITIGWTPCFGMPFSNEPTSICNSVTYNDMSGLWIAVGQDGTNAGNNIVYSYDPIGFGWTSIINTPFSTNGYGNSIAYNDISDLWIVVGYDGTGNGNNILYSTLKPSEPIDFSGNNILYDTISLAWNPPIYVGYPAFTNYILTIDSSNYDISSYTLTADINSYTFDNLNVTTTYNFELYAVNIHGNGLSTYFQKTTGNKVIYIDLNTAVTGTNFPIYYSNNSKLLTTIMDLSGTFTQNFDISFNMTIKNIFI